MLQNIHFSDVSGDNSCKRFGDLQLLWFDANAFVTPFKSVLTTYVVNLTTSVGSQDQTVTQGCARLSLFHQGA
jgi:hypothetical protein